MAFASVLSPTQLMYNPVLHEIVVPDYSGNRVEFISMVDTDGDDVIDLIGCVIYQPLQTSAPLMRIL